MTSYNTNRSQQTITVRDAFPIATFAGDTVYVEFAKLSPSMLTTLLEEGVQRILRDGIGAKDLSDVEKAAKLRKRIDAWLQGSFRIVDRDATLSVLMKEVYVGEQLAKYDGASQKTIETQMRDTVKAQLGDVNATFDNFLKAIAKQVAARKDEKRGAEVIYDALTAKYEEKARALANERAAAAKSIDIDLADIEI